MVKKILSLTLLVFWMVCIFAFSAQSAEESSKLSDRVKEAIIQVIEKIFPQAAEKAETPQGEGALIKFIRKSAHFFAYMLLGVLAVWTFSSYGLNTGKYLFALLICVLYAVSDEIHQIYVPGRAGRIFDVFIDSMGASLGLISSYFVQKKCIRRGCK